MGGEYWGEGVVNFSSLSSMETSYTNLYFVMEPSGCLCSIHYVLDIVMVLWTFQSSIIYGSANLFGFSATFSKCIIG